MINIKTISLLLLLAVVFITGCKKDIEFPPVKELPSENIITIDSLRNIYTAFDTTITGDYSVYGTVTADDVTGNIYKELYIQDATNAIKLDLTTGGNFYIGDRVRVSLKGGTITRDNNMLVIQDINPYESIVRQEANVDLIPEVVTIADINMLNGVYSAYQGKLIQINNVEFVCGDICDTWANAVSQFDENRTLTDTLGNSIIVRSSGFSNFAGNQLPTGQGSIIAVVSQYNSTIQLTIRNPNEATLYGTRKIACANCPVHVKNFDDQSLTSGGWSTQYPTGSILWDVASFSSNYYGNITNGSSQLVGESWLISPAFDLSNTGSPEFSFESASFSSNSALQVMISTNYDGTNLPATATWTDITASLSFSAGSWNWVNSGNFDLTPYKQAGVYIGFKYTGTSSSWDSWEVDNFNLIDL